MKFDTINQWCSFHQNYTIITLWRITHFPIFHNNRKEIMTIPLYIFFSAKIISLFVCRCYLPPCWVLGINIQIINIEPSTTSMVMTFVNKITGKVLSCSIVAFKTDLIIIIFFNSPFLFMVVYFLVIIRISENVIVNPSF